MSCWEVSKGQHVSLTDLQLAAPPSPVTTAFLGLCTPGSLITTWNSLQRLKGNTDHHPNTSEQKLEWPQHECGIEIENS